MLSESGAKGFNNIPVVIALVAIMGLSALIIIPMTRGSKEQWARETALPHPC